MSAWSLSRKRLALCALARRVLRPPSLSAIRGLPIRVDPVQLDAALQAWHEERVAHDRPDRTAIEASLDRYIADGSRLRERLADRSGDGPPLSLSLRQALYDERGLPG